MSKSRAPGEGDAKDFACGRRQRADALHFFAAPTKEKREIYRFLHVTPRRIFEQLDQYVVGQRHAKEVLAIAAYNHLERTCLRSSE